MKCQCGKDVHPLYGSRCEDCWAGSNANVYYAKVYNPRSGVPFHEIRNLPTLQAKFGVGAYASRGRRVRKVT